ncbi:MAG TPA: hypothetical protein PKK43_06615, partial [Spirochaetota bacterium]|nr:hypothetical protein [Spirochaetota bacterium]
VSYNGSPQKIQALVPVEGKDNEFSFTVGKIKCSLRIDMRWAPYKADFAIERTDIWQGMYDDAKSR